MKRMIGYQTETRQFRVPEGKIFVKIATNGEDVWVNAVIGKNGTWENSNSRALGSLVGLLLRSGVHYKTIVKYLRGVTHENSGIIGYDAKSIADAVGLALEERYTSPTDMTENK